MGFILMRRGEFQQVTTTPTTTTPTTTTPTTTPPKPTKLSLRVIQPTKTVEELPKEYLPRHYSWTLWRGGSSGDRMYLASLPRSMKVIFSVNVSANMGGVLAEPVVEEGFIYLADHSGIYSLNRSSGELVWGVEVYGEDLGGRAIGNLQPVSKWRALGLYRFVEAYGLGKYLYVATSSSASGEGDAYLLALDKKSGDVVWRVELESEPSASSATSITSNMVVADGKIFVGSVRDEGYVFCVSEDGKILWRISLGGNVEGMAYGDGTLYVMTSKLYAVDVKDGRVLWQWDYGSWPIYRDGKIIVEHYGNIVVLNSGGKLSWKKGYGAGSNVEGYPYIAVGKQAIYVSRTLGERPRDLYIVDMDSNVLAKYQILSDEDAVAPIASNDVIVIPVRSGKEMYSKLYILWHNAEKLSEIILDIKEEWYPVAVAAYGEVYVVTDPFTLYKLGDDESPLLSNVSVEIDEESRKLLIHVVAQDSGSALYRVMLVYSVNCSKWIYKDMDVARTYVMEPIGGYGYREELYKIALDITPGTSIEFYIVIIDNVGNYVLSNVYAYEVIEE